MEKENDILVKVERAKKELYERIDGIVDEFRDRLGIDDAIGVLNDFVRDSEYMMFKHYITKNIEARLRQSGIKLVEEKEGLDQWMKW